MTASIPSSPRGGRARPRGIRIAAALLSIASIAGPVHAQTSSTTEPPSGTADQQTAQAAAVDARPVSSRADQIVKEQTVRALTLKPYQPNGFEKAIDIAEDLIVTPPVVYPWFGSIYPGGLFAVGAGVRKPYGDTGIFDMHAGWSLRSYTGVEANLHLPELARGRVKVDLHGQYINAPSVQFYGIGQDSPDDITRYKYQPSSVGATLTLAPVGPIAIGGGVDYLDITTGGAKKGTSIEQVFDFVTAPGLDANPSYVRTRAFAGLDWRESPGYTRRGGWYHVEWYDYRQDGGDGLGGGLSFRRTDAEVQQFIPFFRDNWVLAFRGLVSTTDTDAGERVPYFLAPDLGGGSELRGFPSFRFRDNHRVLLTGEYRWAAGQFVDMALFVDAGKVTSRRSELDLDHLETTYGVGVRFHTPHATVLRIEVAKTREGIGLIFTAGQIF